MSLVLSAAASNAGEIGVSGTREEVSSATTVAGAEQAVGHGQTDVAASSSADAAAEAAAAAIPPVAWYGHMKNVTAVAVSPCGQWVASGSADSVVHVRTSTTGRTVWTISHHEEALGNRNSNGRGEVCGVLWSPDGTTLGVAYEFGRIELWNSSTQECDRTLVVENDRFTCHPMMDWCGGGGTTSDRLVAVTDRGMACVWNPRDGELVKMWTLHPFEAHAVQWSKDGRWLASDGMQSLSDRQNIIIIWRTETWCQECTLSGHQYVVVSLAWTKNNQYLASGSYDSTIRIWRMDEIEEGRLTGRCVFVLENHNNWIMEVRWSPDEHWLASASYDETIKLWDMRTGTCACTLGGGSFPAPLADGNPRTSSGGYVNCIAWHPQGDWLVSGGEDRTVRQWYGAGFWVMKQSLLQLGLDAMYALSCSKSATRPPPRPKKLPRISNDPGCEMPSLEMVEKTVRILVAWLVEKHQVA